MLVVLAGRAGQGVDLPADVTVGELVDRAHLDSRRRLPRLGADQDGSEAEGGEVGRGSTDPVVVAIGEGHAPCLVTEALQPASGQWTELEVVAHLRRECHGGSAPQT